MGRAATLLRCFALAALVAAAFSPAIGNEFVNYDDPFYLTGNPMVQEGLTLQGVRWAFSTFHAYNWHPLTWLSHMLDVELFGLDPAGHHGVGIMLHAAVTILFCLALGRMTGARWAPFLAAALWTVHPLRVESVAWAAERKDVLCALLWMATILTYLRHLRRPSAGRAAAVAAVFGLALMVKPMAVTLPLVLLLLDWWPLGRLENAADLRRRVVEKIPLLALAAVSSVITLLAQRQAMTLNEVVSLPSRLANASYSYGRYLGTTLRPSTMALVYPHLGWTLKWSQVAPALLLLVIVSLVAWFGRERAPGAMVGWAWYLVVLVPVIGLVQVGKQAMADRYTYLPSAGLAMAAVWGAAALASRRKTRQCLVLLALGVVCLMIPLTRRQTGYWRDSQTLFSYAVERDPNDWVSRNLLGSELLKRGDIRGAQVHLEEALRRKPDFSDALFNMGLVHQSQGEHTAALAAFLKVGSLDPKDVEARFQAARELAAVGDFRNALSMIDGALGIRPGDPSFRQLRKEILAAIPR